MTRLFAALVPRRLFATLLPAALAACGSAPAEKSDWERRQETRGAPAAELPVALPPYPRAANLIEFSVAAVQQFRFFVDTESISVEGDIVRYALVARSEAGVDNVSYEGMRCGAAQVRQYALGRDGAWARSAAPWRPIQQINWHYVLYREYFCPQAAPIANQRDGVTALRSGGHPNVRSHSQDIPRGF